MSTHLGVFDYSFHVYPSSTFPVGGERSLPQGVLVGQAFFRCGGLEGAPRASVLVRGAVGHGLGGGDDNVVSLRVE
eukprot:3791643-Heterocapsa_arctica.AAC.1